MRIGKHIPSDGANGDDQDEDDGGVHGDDQVLGLRKEEREKQKAQDKGDIQRGLFGDLVTASWVAVPA
jgi:hypothetical protein